MTARERATLAAIYRAFVAPAAIDDVALALVERALLRLPPHRFAKLRPLLALLAPLRFLPVAARERALLALADSPVPLLRSGFQAFKRLCTFTAYAALDENGENPRWTAIGYAGPSREPATPQAPLATVTVTSAETEADVVIVGSGAGGGVAAAAYAAAGKRVVVLEAGAHREGAALPTGEAEAFESLYLEAGLAASDDLAVAILAGACVGGGTTVNWTTSLPLRESTAQQWRDASGGIDFTTTLRSAYDDVRARLETAPSPVHNANNGVIFDGARVLGWDAEAQDVNARGCGESCGSCGFGCRFGNKRSTMQTYLRDAVANGARIVANQRVSRVVIDGGAVHGVVADGVRVRAPLVVVAAGALRTPGILARSGVVSPHLGAHLHVHPTSAIFARFPQTIACWSGPMQTAYSARFADIDDNYGAVIEVAPAHAGLIAMAAPWRGPAAHAALLADSARTASLIAIVRDRGEGRVSLDGRDDVTYALDPFDAAHLREALVGTAVLALAAGADRVASAHTAPLVFEPQADGARFADFARAVGRASTAANRIALFSAHQMGTARMHRDPAQGVVDEWGGVHGVRNLVVSDSSVFPLASGVNPMLTIMALAQRSADARLAQEVFAPA